MFFVLISGWSFPRNSLRACTTAILGVRRRTPATFSRTSTCPYSPATALLLSSKSLWWMRALSCRDWLGKNLPFMAT